MCKIDRTKLNRDQNTKAMTRTAETTTTASEVAMKVTVSVVHCSAASPDDVCPTTETETRMRTTVKAN